MNINLQNIESVIFFDRQIRKLLPDFRNEFGQWDLAQHSSTLRSLGKRTVLNVLNSLNDEHVEILESYFKEPVTLMKLDHHIVRHSVFALEDSQSELNQLDGWVGEFAICRDADHLYVSNWR